ncbi:MAG: hypothetical protein JW840_02475 [Candidatus Thermoplasmatota archaeon]|nr:hypothetical protein [Candidatus Thermoplasmatota archaeon]
MKSMISVLFIAILLFSGCVNKIPDNASEIGNRLKTFFDESTDFVTKNLHHEDINLIHGIASLPALDENTIDTFQKYQHFADSVNALFKFLNREGGYDFQILKGTQEEYEKISKIVTEYTPLIDNYNSVIYASRNYNENDSDSVEKYYKALGILGLEFTIIYTALWYSPTYKAVGMVYRWSGLNKLAFRCPTLISFILSKAHWGLRSILVNTSSETVDFFIDKLSSYKE